jgi:hypothetical protein
MKIVSALFHSPPVAATFGVLAILWSSQLPAFSQSPVITSISRNESGDVLLSWTAIPGRTYAVEHKSDLTQSDWNTVDVIVAQSETESLLDNSSGDSQRFYRMILQPTFDPGSKPAVFRGDGEWELRNTKTTGDPNNTFSFGAAGDIPIMGDWNGDGTRTPGVFRDGQWFLRNTNSSSPVDINFWFGDPGDIPLVGDWNGDGIETIGLFRNSTGTWYLRNANSTGSPNLTFLFGDTGDIPVTGDWNGDGIDTPGIYRGNHFYLRNFNSTGSANIDFEFGNSGDKPIVGDWNNDNVTTIGVVSGTSWLLRNANSAGAAEVTFDFGISGDTPLVWK